MADTAGARRNDPGTPDVFLRRVAVGHPGFEPAPASRVECDRNPCAGLARVLAERNPRALSGLTKSSGR